MEKDSSLIVMTEILRMETVVIVNARSKKDGIVKEVQLLGLVLVSVILLLVHSLPCQVQSTYLEKLLKV